VNSPKPLEGFALNIGGPEPIDCQYARVEVEHGSTHCWLVITTGSAGVPSREVTLTIPNDQKYRLIMLLQGILK
jgi:hypothetical protein